MHANSLTHPCSISTGSAIAVFNWKMQRFFAFYKHREIQKRIPQKCCFRLHESTFFQLVHANLGAPLAFFALKLHQKVACHTAPLPLKKDRNRLLREALL